MSKQVRVGLIGYGFSGKCFQAPVINAVEGLQLTKVVERSRNESKERYPWVEIVRSIPELLQDDQIDLVIIATPSTNHFEVAKEALLAGKHVVVEKPFTATVEQADELIALAKDRDKVLSVFHNRRWDGDFLTIQKMLQNQLLGDVLECEMRWDRFDPVVRHERWKESDQPGAGVLYDLGSHLIDQSLRLFGSPDSVEGDVRIQREGGRAEDYFDIILNYSSGLKISLKSSKFVRMQEPRYRLHGTGGSFVKYGLDPQEEALKQGQTPLSSNWGVESEEQWGTIDTTVGEMRYVGKIETLPGAYQQYYQNVHDAIVHGEELAVKPQQARETIRLIELARQSSEEKRAIMF